MLDACSGAGHPPALSSADVVSISYIFSIRQHFYTMLPVRFFKLPAYLENSVLSFPITLFSTGTATAKAEYMTMSKTTLTLQSICIYKARELIFSIDTAPVNGI